MEIEFHRPERAHSREDNARMFCSMIARALTYSSCKCRDEKLKRDIIFAREKFHTIRSYVSESLIVGKIGPILLNWREQIERYDDNFFATVDIVDVIATIAQTDQDGARDIAHTVERAPVDDCARYRAAFVRATTSRERVVLFDVLRLLLVLYAQHELSDS